MSTEQTSRIGLTEGVSSVISAVVGATLAGAVIQLTGGAEAMEGFAALVGAETLTAGWAVWLGQGVVFGVGFALVVARTINPFTASIIRVSRRSRLLQRLLVPLLHRSGLGVTTGSMGFLYGQFVLLPLFAYLAPVVMGLHGHAVAVPLATVSVVLGYLVYGSVMGATYGLVLEIPWFDLRLTDEYRAGLVGAVAGGIVGTAVLGLVGGPETLSALGAPTGSASARRGALVVLAVTVGFGLAFVSVLARTINDFTNTVIMFSRRSELTQKILVPLITRAALTVTAGSMGLVYGLVLGIGAVGLGAVGVVPQTGLAGLLAFTVYGNVLGNVYGLGMETVDLSGLGPSEELRAGFVGSVGAGLLSGGFVALALGVSVFGDLATLVGATDSIAGIALPGPVVGFVLWMGTSVVLGLVFVAYVARTINDFTNTVIMFSRRSELTQKILVPLITRAALTVTAGSMGLVYGLVLGVVAYGGVLVGVLPPTGPLVVLAFVVYGHALGTSYGLQLEDVDLRLPAVFSRDDESSEQDVSLIEIDYDWFKPWSSGTEDEESTQQSVRLIEVDDEWFERRPTRGAGLLLLAGAIMAVVSFVETSGVAGPSPAALGIVFGTMLAACGVFALAKPDLSTVVGVTGVSLSVLSVVGAFGGLFVGMVAGFVGGSHCLAWEALTEHSPTSDGESVRMSDQQVGD